MNGRFVVLSLGAVAVFSACGLPLVPFEHSEGKGSVALQGYVSSTLGGDSVANSVVTVDGMAEISSATDATGKFELNLDPGTYNLNFKKPGYAASRIEGFTVSATGATNIPLNVIQRVNVHGLPAVAPSITLKTFSGDTESEIVSGQSFDINNGIPLAYTVTASDPSLSPEELLITTGNTPSRSSLENRKRIEIDPKYTTYSDRVTLYQSEMNVISGKTVLNSVVYDFAGNRTQKLIPITLNGGIGLGTVSKPTLQAITLGSKFSGMYSPTGAPDANSTMFVEIRWNYSGSILPLGFKILKSFDGTNFDVLKTVQGNVSYDRDRSADLAAGKQVYYKIEVFNSLTYKQSEASSVTPLDVFRVKLLTPANHATGISVKPELKWEVSKEVGAVRHFYPMISDYPAQGSGCEVWGSICGFDEDHLLTDDKLTPSLIKTGNTYSIAYNGNGTALLKSLEPYHTYTFWLSAAAYNADKTAISIAQDARYIFAQIDQCNFGGPVCEGELNTFTTGDGSF